MQLKLPISLYNIRKQLTLMCVGLLCGVFVATNPPIARADDNFQVDLVTSYHVDGSATSTVEHQFTITNKTPTYFINRYGLKLSAKGIKNVSVLFNNKPIPAEVVHDNTLTSIGIEFPENVVGEGKQLHFTVRYQNPNTAQLSGHILEVTIPKLANAQEYNSYSINLYTPAQFGQPVRSTPTPISITTEGQSIVSHFEQTKAAGISVIFGNTQIYQLNLQYQLTNSGSQPVLSQITLPPDTAFQRLNYQKIEPPPVSIKTDVDGNWLATYRLEPNTDFRVLVLALAQVKLDPDPTIPEINPSYQHLTAQDYWETTSPEIIALASKTTDSASVYQTTVDTLEYTTEPLSQNMKRLGAVKALAEPLHATCQEYTDLFIALARSKDIPSRRATGYAQTQDGQLRPVGVVGDILHAWPEYFDSTKKIWIPVDPTWGDTTGGVDYFHQFDLNHVVFAYQGASSTLPYPAGSYRPGSKPEKLIDVQFAATFPESIPDVSISIEPKKLWLLPIPGMYTLVITNRTGFAWHQLNYQATSIDQAPVQIRFNEAEESDILLPFQTLRIPVSAYNTDESITASRSYAFNLKIKDEIIAGGNASLLTLPASLGRFGLTLSFAIVAISLVTLTLIAGSVLIFWRRRRHSVRR